MLISKSQFVMYQETFYKKLLQTPHKIKLEVIETRVKPNDGEFSIDSFVGDSIRESKFYEFQALYEKDIPNRVREKYGLADTVNGVIYLSPKQLKPKLGTHVLNMNRTKVHFCGRVQVIDKIIYLEEMYDSCIGVQIFVKDDLQGG